MPLIFIIISYTLRFIQILPTLYNDHDDILCLLFTYIHMCQCILAFVKAI